VAETITAGCTYPDKYEKPTQNDNGDLSGELIEIFMERMARHTHSNTDSNPITLNIDKDETKILNVDQNWVTDGDLQRITVSSATGSTRLSNHFRKYYIGLDSPTTPVWEDFSPSITWISDTEYYLYSNITNKDIKVYTI